MHRGELCSNQADVAKISFLLVCLFFKECEEYFVAFLFLTVCVLFCAFYLGSLLEKYSTLPKRKKSCRNVGGFIYRHNFFVFHDVWVNSLCSDVQKINLGSFVFRL